MVAKLVGKEASKYGLGYGLFTYLDFPLANENQSFRIELMDLAFRRVLQDCDNKRR